MSKAVLAATLPLSASFPSATKPDRLARYALSLVVLAFVVVNLRWVWLYRGGRALDIDEAGYLNLALIDYHGLLNNDLAGWIAAVLQPSIQAPLTMALTSILFDIAGPHVMLGFIIPLAAGAGCIAATYELGVSMGSRRAGLVAAIFVASCPLVITFSRTYNFAMPATLIATLALLAILRSRHFRSYEHAFWFGVLLGFMPLARTMTLAFVPGLAAAAFVVVVIDPIDRVRRLAVLAASFVIAAIVAATWFWQNGVMVVQYLLGFGYGSHAAEYATRASPLPFHLIGEVILQFGRDVYLPHYAVLCLGLLALLLSFVRLTGESGLRPALSRCLHSPILPVAIVFTEGLLILNTTDNRGSGFAAPIFPALAALTAIAFEKAFRSSLATWSAYGLMAAVSIAAFLPLIDLESPLAAEKVARLPLIGAVTFTDGRANIQRYESAGGYVSNDSRQPVSAATEHGWTRLELWTANMLDREIGPSSVVVFGFRNILYNVNTINLMQLLHSDSAFAVRQIDPISTGDSIDRYADWLQKQNSDACVLLTSDRVSGDFEPVVNRRNMEEAAVKSGFTRVKQWPAPDGQVISMWQRPDLPANCRRAT